MIYQNRTNTACNHKAMVQLSDNQKVRALALREAGMKQKDVATRLGVSVRTIRTLEKRADGMRPGDVPARKPGSGKK